MLQCGFPIIEAGRSPLPATEGEAPASVHHIRYDKSNCGLDLNALCCSCYAKVSDNLRTFLEKDVGWDGTKDSETGGMRNKFGFEICPKCHRELPEDKNGNLGHCLYCTNPFELERPRQ